MAVLARLLLNKNVVTRTDLARAFENQVVYGGRLGTNLIELGLATEKEVADALAEKYGVPTLPVREEELDLSLLERIGKDRCIQHKVFPHSLQSKTLRLLMLDPSDHVAKAEVAYSSSYMVRPFVVTEHRMLELLEHYCGASREWRFEDHQTDYIGLARRRRDASAQVTPAPEMPKVIEPLGAKEAISQLAKAQTRDAIIHLALRVARGYAARVIFYIVRRGHVLGWDCAGEGLDRRMVRGQAIPLSEPSIFQTVHDNPGPFMGKIPRTNANDLLRKAIEKRKGNALLLPILLAGRVVNLIYCDAGPMEDLEFDLQDLLLFIQRMPEAYARLIQKRLEEMLPGQ